MKKLIILGMLALFCAAFTGCSSCHSDKTKQDIEKVESTVAIQKMTETVEQQIAVDREYVWLHYGHQYKWYETEVMFENFFDAEDAGFSILEAVNIFQAEKTAIKCQHFDEYTEYGDAAALWVGDFDLSEENVKLTFKDAYDRMQQANYVKPHGRFCTLRREVGPIPNINPQYVFGNKQRQLYVDAVTGEVTDNNPAFTPDKLP